MTDRTRRALLATLAGGLAGLAGCAGIPTTDEPPSSPATGTPTTSAEPPAARAPTPIDLEESATRWAVQFDRPVTSTPAVGDGMVVAGTGYEGFGTPTPGADFDWSLAALDVEDGATAWTHRLPAPTFGAPRLAGDAVLVPTGFSTGYTGTNQRLLKVAGGERRWTTDASTGFNSLLAVGDDATAYVGTSDDALDTGGERLFAVDGADGSLTWNAETGDAFGGRLVDEGLLVDVAGMVIERHDTDDGARTWRNEAQAMTDAPGSIPVVDGVVPVAKSDGDAETLAALDVADGSVRWTLADGGGGAFVPTGATAVPEGAIATEHDGVVVCTEYDGVVFGIAPSTGDRLWRFEMAGESRDGPVADGDRVFVGDLSGSVYALSATDGSELWRADAGGSVGSLGVAGDVLVVRDGKGAERLVGLDAADGSTRWTFETDENLTLPVLGDGVAAVGSERGIVRVLGD